MVYRTQLLECSLHGTKPLYGWETSDETWWKESDKNEKINKIEKVTNWQGSNVKSQQSSVNADNKTFKHYSWERMENKTYE